MHLFCVVVFASDVARLCGFMVCLVDSCLCVFVLLVRLFVRLFLCVDISYVRSFVRFCCWFFACVGSCLFVCVCSWFISLCMCFLVRVLACLCMV